MRLNFVFTLTSMLNPHLHSCALTLPSPSHALPLLWNLIFTLTHAFQLCPNPHNPPFTLQPYPHPRVQTFPLPSYALPLVCYLILILAFPLWPHRHTFSPYFATLSSLSPSNFAFTLTRPLLTLQPYSHSRVLTLPSPLYILTLKGWRWGHIRFRSALTRAISWGWTHAYE